MGNVSNGYPFDSMWDEMRVRNDLEPLSKEDGYRWGLSHIAYVKKELLKLEESALARKDVGLLHDIVGSKLRAAEVEQELWEKLNEIQK